MHACAEHVHVERDLRARGEPVLRLPERVVARPTSKYILTNNVFLSGSLLDLIGLARSPDAGAYIKWSVLVW